MSASATPATAIGAWLERSRATLDEEIRRCPPPIARCDLQLGGLIDRRGAAPGRRPAAD